MPANHSVLVVVVLYNVPLERSKTIQGFLSAFDHLGFQLPVLFYDNSEVLHINNDIYLENFSKAMYVHDRSNPGVSSAYNYGAEVAKDLDIKHLWIFDQDSEVTTIFVEKMLTALTRYPDAHLVAPIVMDKSTHQMMSPSLWFFGRGFRLPKKPKSSQPTILRFLSFVNSGAMIRAETLLLVGSYNTRLFYFSDHDFFKRLLRQKGEKIIVDEIMLHDFSSTSTAQAGEARKRFCILLSNVQHLPPAVRIAQRFWCLLRSAKLSLKYGDSGFISDYWIHLFKPKTKIVKPDRLIVQNTLKSL